MRDMKHDHTKPRTYLGLFPRSSQGLDAVTSGGCPQLQSRRAKAGVLTRCLCPRVRVEISIAPPSSHRNQLRTFAVSHLSSIYSALLSKAAPRFSLQEEFLSSWASWWGCHSSSLPQDLELGVEQLKVGHGAGELCPQWWGPALSQKTCHGERYTIPSLTGLSFPSILY